MRTQLHNIKLLISITLLLLSTLAFAQDGINYQGLAKDASNELIADTDITLTINIIKTAVNGETVYSETHTATTNASGVFSITIGDGTPTLNQFDDIIWGEDDHFLNVWLNGTEIGTTQFTAVPYAKSTETFGKWVATSNGVEPENTGYSIFIGRLAGDNDDLTFNRNVAIGDEALQNNTTGNQNIAIGSDALYSNISGEYNIAIGQNALEDNVEGTRNIALGENALSSKISGNNNIVLGTGSLSSNQTGNRNVSIGYNAGSNNANGDNNVFIGAFAGYNEIGSSQRLCISNTVDNFPLIYGKFDEEILGFDAKVGIGTQNPRVSLHILPGTDASLSEDSGYFLIGSPVSENLVFDNNEIQARENGVTSTLYLQHEGGDVRIGGELVQTSDKRLKRDIANISYGLKDILQLRPTEYFWKGKTQEHKSLGLIAQEVDEVIKNVVTYDKKEDKYGVSYTELIPVLIKAIQEQENTIQTLQNEVSELRASINNTSN